MIWNGSAAVLDGTSCSAPIAASVISLVNDALMAAGKASARISESGKLVVQVFHAHAKLLQSLYKSGYKAFRDVVRGSCSGCYSDGLPAKETIEKGKSKSNWFLAVAKTWRLHVLKLLHDICQNDVSVKIASAWLDHFCKRSHREQQPLPHP